MAKPGNEDIIGRVEWDDDQGSHAATMASDGHWGVASRPPRPFDALLALDLDGRFLDSYLATGPADGFPGFRELHAAAEHLGGAAIPADPEPGSDGTVY